tara:strand:+ start:2437 stop:2550 length:114 start_codon:yes stop_codon:yes gene_type:complete
MEDLLMMGALALSAAVGFLAGMYITTQIGDWINKRIK